MASDGAPSRKEERERANGRLRARVVRALALLAALYAAAPGFAFAPCSGWPLPRERSAAVGQRQRRQVHGGRARSQLAATLLAEPPAPPIEDIGTRKEPKFAQCIVEYKDGTKSRGEGWLFHMDAATEDTERAEVKPSFPRLLRRSAHIWNRGTAVTCTPLESLPFMGGPCAECVRFFTGGIYGTGVIVPAIDYADPSKSGWAADECLALREQQPPKNGKPSDTGGGSMSGHDTRMSPFCRTTIFPGLD